tara:strand:- start:5957 stop:6685 length:729 start_codon:yes stop_codon:yes gene_type:complete
LSPKKDDKKSKAIGLSSYRPLNSEDFVDHLQAFEEFYLNSKNAQVYNLYRKEEKFLEGIARDITKNNELFFTSTNRPTFKIIKHPAPFHFSLPGLKIFISSGLISKYIKSEKLLYSVIAYELIRSEKRIYRKSLIVPTGYLTTSRMLGLMRLKTTDKVEIHKWAFYTLKRVGVDPDIYLSWLQIQNRNSLDFAVQLGDTSSISREESMFKAFLIEQANAKSGQAKYERSSREFYSFVNRLKR